MALLLAVILAASLFAGSVGTASATSILSVSVEQMLEASELVFEGRVLEVQARRGRASHSIRTCAVFEIAEVIKGDAPRGPLELCFSGGSIGRVRRHVAGMLYPQPGETGIYFVESLQRAQINPFYGWQQGHFYVEGDGEDRIVTNANHVPIVGIESTSSSPTEVSVGTARGIVLSERPNGATGSHAQGEEAHTPLGPEEFKAALRALGAPNKAR